MSSSESDLNSTSYPINQPTISLEEVSNFLNQSLNMSAVVLSNNDDEQTNYFTNILERLNSLEQKYNKILYENKKLCEKVERLQDDIDETWDSLYYTERELSQFQQYSRRQNIEIAGIPESVPHHDLEEIVINILRRIGVQDLQSYEIVGCHRLKKMNKFKPANIIIRFVNRKRAYQCLENRKYLKNIVREFGTLLIEENLCPKYKSIHEKCSKLKDHGKIKQLWTYNGIVHYKKTDRVNERGTKVFHILDLEEQFPEINNV